MLFQLLFILNIFPGNEGGKRGRVAEEANLAEAALRQRAARSPEGGGCARGENTGVKEQAVAWGVAARLTGVL